MIFCYNVLMHTAEYSDTKEAWIQLSWKSHYYKAQHSKSLQREKVLKAKIQELELTLDHKEVQIKELIAGFQKTIDEQNAQTIKLHKCVENLKAQNAWLKQRIFGRQSEQSNSSREHNNSNCTNVSAIEMPQTKRPRGQQAKTTGHGRKSRIHLPSIEIIHD